MSLIPCIQNCKYQTDGLCTLAQAQSIVNQAAVPNDVCLNFTPRQSDQNGNSLPDVAHTNQI